jgi:ATP-dependent Lhr-like helicase
MRSRNSHGPVTSGIKLIDKVIPIINSSKTTLIFINTRGMSEIWYQSLLKRAPELAGAIALHHGSIDHELRIWVEEALHSGTLKAVVCTASLDLGVDFRPVETGDTGWFAKRGSPVFTKSRKKWS